MKKKLAALMLIAALLGLAACGGGDAPAETPSPAPLETAAPTPKATPTPEPADRVEFEIKSETLKKEIDGALIGTASFEYPVLIVNGSPEADIEALEKWCADFYNSRLEGAQLELEGAVNEYEMNPVTFMGAREFIRTLEPVHTDEKLAVFIERAVLYTGGSNPIHETAAFNLELHTGRELTLSDLGDEAQLRRALEEEIQRQITEQGLKSQLYENYADLIYPGIQNGRWSLTEDGLAVVFPEYYLAPYSYGSAEFVIDYEALENVISPDYVIQ